MRVLNKKIRLNSNCITQKRGEKMKNEQKNVATPSVPNRARTEMKKEENNPQNKKQNETQNKQNTNKTK